MERLSPEKAYEKLLSVFQEAALWETIESALAFDRETALPPQAIAWRSRQESFLAERRHRLLSDPFVSDLLETAQKLPQARDPLRPEAVNLREWRREIERLRRIPTRLVEALAETCAKAQAAWAQAKRENDFSLFLPHLENILTLVRERCDCLGFERHPLEAALVDYDPGLDFDFVDHLLGALSENIPRLLQRRQCDPEEENPLYRPAPIEAQSALCRKIAEFLGFDFTRGQSAQTAHPFTTRLGPHDVRWTLRFEENNFQEAFFSTLHEVGHALYDQGLPPEHFGTPRGEAAWLSVHESQSRFFENIIGRNFGFWRFFYPQLQKHLPAFEGLPLETFFRALLRVRPSLIRTQADEVTYPLHIAIRWTLEKELLSGKLAARALPERWRAEYRAKLGLEPSTDAEGCLQDIHFALGAFGYFPTYAAGNVLAACWKKAAEKRLGRLEELLARGEVGALLRWLRENIHAFGKTYLCRELVRKIADEELSFEIFLADIEERYTAA